MSSVLNFSLFFPWAGFKFLQIPPPHSCCSFYGQPSSKSWLLSHSKSGLLSISQSRLLSHKTVWLLSHSKCWLLSHRKCWLLSHRKSWLLSHRKSLLLSLGKSRWLSQSIARLLSHRKSGLLSQSKVSLSTTCKSRFLWRKRFGGGGKSLLFTAEEIPCNEGPGLLRNGELGLGVDGEPVLLVTRKVNFIPWLLPIFGKNILYWQNKFYFIT